MSRFVERLHGLEPLNGRATHDRLPDGRTALIARVHTDGTGDIYVAGPRTRALFKSPTGVQRAVVANVKPGWAGPLFGVAMHELADRMVRLDDLWGRAGANVFEAVQSARTMADAIECLGAAITERLRTAFEPASASLARRGARMLDAGENRVERAANRLGVSSRHLRRAFLEHIGVGPKQYVRGVRLQRAMAAPPADWGRIATTAGYYDQAHLIGEFRDLVGLTPAAYARR